MDARVRCLTEETMLAKLNESTGEGTITLMWFLAELHRKMSCKAPLRRGCRKAWR